MGIWAAGCRINGIAIHSAPLFNIKRCICRKGGFRVNPSPDPAPAAAAPKKEDRRVRRTKKLLVQALTELLQQKQPQDITVRELAERADMNRGTFYLYYRDISDMLEKIEDQLFDSLNAIVRQHEDENVLREPAPLLMDLFLLIAENREMVRVLLSPRGDMKFLEKLYDVIRSECLKAFPVLREGPDSAGFEYRFGFVTFGIAGLIRAWVNGGCRETAPEMSRLAGSMIRHGCLDPAAGPVQAAP